MTFVSAAAEAVAHEAAARAQAGVGAEMLSLDMQFISAGLGGARVQAVVKPTRVTRTMVFLTIQLRAGDECLASAAAVYRIVSSGAAAQAAVWRNPLRWLAGTPSSGRGRCVHGSGVVPGFHGALRDPEHGGTSLGRYTRGRLGRVHARGTTGLAVLRRPCGDGRSLGVDGARGRLRSAPGLWFSRPGKRRPPEAFHSPARAGPTRQAWHRRPRPPAPKPAADRPGFD